MGISSRKKIEKACKHHSVTILSLDYERNGQHMYGDYSDESEWILEFETKDFRGNLYQSQAHGYNADELIACMLDDIQDALDGLPDGKSL